MTVARPLLLGRPLAPRLLIGRTVELERLAGFVDEVRLAGRSAAMIGEPGVGKSVLVSALVSMAERSGMRVLSTSGRQVSHSGLARLLLAQTDPARIGDLSGLQQATLRRASLQDLGSVAEPLVIYNAILSLLATIGSERPFLLVVDDLDEADDAMRDTLAFITRRPGRARVGIMLVGTQNRGIPVDETIPVGRLSSTDATELVRSLHPEMPTRARATVTDNAAGNPLVVLEQLRGRDSARRTDTSSFSHRLGVLPAATRRAVLMVALGRAGNLRSLAAAGLDIDDLDPAEESGLLRIHPAALTATFTHPLIASLVVSMASEEEVREAHLAHAHSGSGTLEADAIHLAEAATEPSESTAAMLEIAAGEAIARGESATATDLLTRAAQLSPSAIDRQRRMARAALFSTHTFRERQLSARLLLDSRATDADDTVGSLYTAVATAMQQLADGAGSPAAGATVRVAVEEGSHGWDGSNAELLDAMNAWLVLCWTSGRPEEWAAYFEALDRLQPAAPDALRALSIGFGDPANATAWDRVRLNRMLATLSQDDDPAYILQTLTAALYFDQISAGAWAARQLLQSGRAIEGTLAHLRVKTLIALHDVETGRWDDAERLVDSALAATPAVLTTPAVGMLVYVKSLVAALRGDVEAMTESARRLDDLADYLTSDAFRRFAAHGRVVAAAGRGMWEEVYRQAAIMTTPGTLDRYVPQAIRVAFELVVASTRTKRFEVARAQYRGMVEAELAAHSPRLEMLTLAAGAVVDTEDRWDREFSRALDVSGADGWPFDHARVRFEYALRLGRAGRTAEAVDQLDRAFVQFQRLGADSWAAQARTERRILSEASPRTPRSALTAQELAIAELAAQGFTNKEIGQRLFLSARTVSGHLYHAFPKLGISKRSSLRDALNGLQYPEERALA